DVALITALLLRRNRDLHDETARPRIGNTERTQREQRERWHDLPLTPGSIWCERTNEPFDDQAKQRRRRERGILLWQVPVGDRSRDQRGKFAGERAPKRQPCRFKLSVYRLGDHRASTTAMAQRPRRKRRDRRGNRGQRAGRCCSGAAQNGDLALRYLSNQCRNQIR